MPNWCSNSLVVKHSDPEMIKKFAEAVEAGNLLETFIPMPAELRNTESPGPENAELVEKYGASDWYHWSVSNWGTKWDISEGYVSLDDDGSCTCSFETAWSPPLEAYQKLQKLGFSIDAGYFESGMGFIGTWVDGEENYINDYFDLFEDEEWQRSVYPEYILDVLEGEYEWWLQSKEEEE